jgi:hypothetical protein
MSASAPSPPANGLSPAILAILSAPEPPARETPFSALGPAPNGDALSFDPQTIEEKDHRLTRYLSKPREGNDWDGERRGFVIWLGLTLMWPVPNRPDGRCGACGGEKLSADTYCLVCNRCGRELRIPSAGVDAPGRKRYRKDKLAGGQGQQAKGDDRVIPRSPRSVPRRARRKKKGSFSTP